MPSYKSYCWSLGTTSFRMVEFNKKIEEQLRLLNQFWHTPEYTDENGVQTALFKLLTIILFESKALLRKKMPCEKIKTQEKKLRV